MKRLTFCIVWIALLCSVPPAHSQDEISWLLQQINTLRASVGVPAYSLNGQLSAAAQQHSTYMATTCDVSHTESNGSTPVDRARANGYTGSWVSENIYGGGMADATYAWNFWLNSPVHYQGMTSANMNEIGIGIASGECGHFYTLVFGSRSDVSVPLAAVQGPSAPTTDTGVDQPAAAPATRAPYVPPPPTLTPTPTINTLTPSATWTITPTYTPSPTGTQMPPTATPLILPTVPALDIYPTALPMRPSDTPPPMTQVAMVIPTYSTPAGIQIQPPAEPKSTFNWRDLIPFALIGQIVLIAVAGFVYYRRTY
jgi:hypothetical protein